MMGLVTPETSFAKIGPLAILAIGTIGRTRLLILGLLGDPQELLIHSSPQSF